MRRPILLSALALGLVASVITGLTTQAAGKGSRFTNRFAPSGVVTVDPNRAAVAPAAAKTDAKAAGPVTVGTSGCSDLAGSNVRVNQDCTNQSYPGFTGRAQSQNETAVAVNPNDPRSILASQNDYRRGDGTCGVDFSLDGGRHWGSRTAPTSFTPGLMGRARHYWNAGGDTSVAFDSSGEAYLMCQVFDRVIVADLGLPQAFGASAFLLFRSADGGASWSFPGDYVAKTDGTGADGIGLLDKEYMALDSNPASPFADRIYVAWAQYNTTFAADPITFAYSTDHGVTWHNSGAISGFSASLCPINFSGAPAGTCDANQFPQPFVAPNGDVYVVFQNFNNCAGAFGPPCSGDPNDNHNQMLIVKSTDGGNTFGSPVKVADFYDLPDCVTYTGFDAGRACVPTTPLSGKSIFRATNYPTGVAVSNTSIVVDLGSYLNPHSNPSLGNCSPAGFAPTGLNRYTGVGVVNGCNNDIVRSMSTDGGATFTGTTLAPWDLPSVNDEGNQLADQWWQWSALGPNGTVVDSYYDRTYADDMATGNMDITLAYGSQHKRVTDVHMPPSNEFPAANGYSLFLGDYNAVAVGTDGVAHPVWADTRNPIFAPSGADARILVPAGFGADIYTRAMPVG